jgi:hypothetical protein
VIELGQPRVAPSYRSDGAGALRVIAKAVTFGDKAHAAFTDIRRLAENLQSPPFAVEHERGVRVPFHTARRTS